MPFGAFAWLVRGTVWMAGVGTLTLLLASGATWRLDTALYDQHLRYWPYAPGNDLVIVAIDSKSLNAVGRWPWPRSVHARLVDRLAAAGVRAIGMDVTMPAADTGQPENDHLLAQAMRREGKVVMPMFAESADLGGPIEEMLPIPALAEQAAAIGHVDVAKDPDGLVRGAYLRAGLGRAYWPALALALYGLGQPAAQAQRPLPGMRDPSPDDASPYLWKRDNYVLLRYAGTAGRFGRVSYSDVLDGSAPAALLKGRSVLVGATAEGMGDIIQTPISAMPGVEYQANIYESLRRGLLVTPLGFLGQFLLGSGMLALPLLLYGLPGFRRAWRAALAAVVLILALDLCLLRIGYLWWPPAGCVLVIGAGLAGWHLFVRRAAAGADAAEQA
ncbi:diguanylate cyclase [Frateuria sp. Soil773]|uniref:CHASE2 domain-containing protein n=1 Tax=Frateuria sp. Soil773 TaxID=1736407 RepID=UPI0006F91D6F|nr:CHASE2 domain-containing protein [Frateuria sp. Soil773]KRE99476.1 diguanylate cyclase [Frateuria sp. Soil773]